MSYARQMLDTCPLTFNVEALTLRSPSGNVGQTLNSHSLRSFRPPRGMVQHVARARA